MEVEMKIRGLMMDPVTNMPIVILKDVGGSSLLPIWVGVYEANAIALEIEKVSTPRPMTHDLIKTLLLGLNAGIRKVVVNDLKDDTFYVLERDGFVALVERLPDGGFGRAGAPARLLEGAFAVLVWRGGEAHFVAKGREETATAEQVAAVRRFDAELREALG